ncbi:hypothetical protein PHMEG_00016280 [Phytophthora megakarya]|uniref:Uncharacterized protein n=1 Tax=Phytophthora megakarya TaxID=4795 RepID=A0A225VZP0_9STRA|nr:hypothetical protein PHMEG_00016280 [Phytophthora megakarya]
MAKGDKSAVPTTPMKSGGMHSEASGRSRSSYSTPTTSRMTPITERSVSFNDSVEYSDAKEDDENDYLEEKAFVSELSEDRVSIDSDIATSGCNSGSTTPAIKEAPVGELAESSSQTVTTPIPSSTTPPVIDMTADDPNPLGDSDSDSDASSVPSRVTETRPISTVHPPVASPLVSTPLSEERLWELLNSSSQYTLESVCQAMDDRLAKMLRFYATLHWAPNVRGRTNFKRRLDAVQSFEDVVICSEPVPADALTGVGRELAAVQASLKSAEASRTVTESKLFSEQCDIKLVKSREASLNVRISETNAVIKSHQEIYDRLENRMQLALRSNEILTKEVNHGRSEYLVGIQAFKKSHENLHKLLSHTDSKEITLTSKPRERNRDLVRRVKRLEKANSALSSRLRLEDMGPEALVLMVEDTPCSEGRLQDWFGGHDTLADDIARAKVRFAEIRAEKQREDEEAAAAAGLPAPPPLMAGFSAPQLSVATATPSTSRSLAITRTGPPVVVTNAGSSTSSAPPSAAPAGSSQSSAVPPVHSSPASTPPAPPVSGGKKGKGKAKRRHTSSDDEDVDFGGGDSGESAPEEGRECSATSSSATTSQPQPKKQKASSPASPPTPAEKFQPSSKSSSSKPSVPAPGHHKAGSAPKRVDVTVSDAESMSRSRLTPKRKAAMSSEFRSSFRLAEGSRSDIKSLTSKSSPGQSVKSSSKSKKSRSKKATAKTKSGRSSSDESVISVSSESESESSSDQDSSVSEGSEAYEDEESELSKLLEASTKPKSKAKPASAAKADSKSSPKGKKKASPKSTGKKKSSAKAKKVTASKKKSKSSPKTSRSSKKTKSQDVTDESSLDANLPDWISKYPELVKLAQRASDLLTPFVAPEFTTVSVQKYWIKLEQAFLPSLVPSDAEVKCTTVGIEKFCKFMAPDHPWRKAMDLWPEHACLSDTTDFQQDSHISQRSDYPERLCGVWRQFRGYGNEKQAVMSFAIYERKHWHRKFKLALERLKKVWFKYNKELETLGPQIVPDSTLEPEDIDSSWDRAFRGDDEDEEMEEGEVKEDDADSTAILDLNQDSAGDTRLEFDQKSKVPELVFSTLMSSEDGS